jgi:uncharacterized protein (TIGR02217 family)
MAFIEQRLLDCVSYGTQGGPTFATVRVGLRSGVVRRSARRSRPMYRYTILYQALLPEHHTEVVRAFNACLGGAYGFRLKDWFDFAVANQPIGTGTGASQTLPLIKEYTFGAQTVQRRIRKPVAGTVSVTANNTPIASTLNTATGEVTFTATAGHIIRWSGQFDVPVMFENDELTLASVARSENGLVLAADVPLVEDLAA